jgi:hypothetical protein
MREGVRGSYNLPHSAALAASLSASHLTPHRAHGASTPAPTLLSIRVDSVEVLLSWCIDRQHEVVTTLTHIYVEETIRLTTSSTPTHIYVGSLLHSSFVVQRV